MLIILTVGNGTVTVTGDLNVTGDITYDETVARNLNITGVATVGEWWCGYSGIVSTGDFKIGTATTLSQDNIFTTGIITASGGLDAIGIQSTPKFDGINMAVGVITALNFVGSGNTFLYDASNQTIDISIGGGVWGIGSGTDKVFYENDQTVTQSTRLVW